MTINDIKSRGLLLFECISGSKAYGLDNERSDTDIKGVYYLDRDQFYGLHYVDQISNDTNDEVYYELGRFVELLLRNNPNLLEILASPRDCVLFRHPVMDCLSVDMFLSLLCKDTFGGYALTQLQKAGGLKKKMFNPVAPQRKSVLDFCHVVDGFASFSLQDWLTSSGLVQEKCGLSAIPHAKGLYALFYDVNDNFQYRGVLSGPAANEVSLSSIPIGEHALAYLHFNKEGYSSYCKEYQQYWQWMKVRNEDRYLGNMEHGKGYDAKNMMHMIRLLKMGVEILSEGAIKVRRSDRDELLAIKSGHFSYDQLMEMASTLMDNMQSAAAGCKLMEAPDKNRVEALLVKMRNELYLG